MKQYKTPFLLFLIIIAFLTFIACKGGRDEVLTDDVLETTTATTEVEVKPDVVSIFTESRTCS
jgi:hypothetical protein